MWLVTCFYTSSDISYYYQFMSKQNVILHTVDDIIVTRTVYFLVKLYRYNSRKRIVLFQDEKNHNRKPCCTSSNYS